MRQHDVGTFVIIFTKGYTVTKGSTCNLHHFDGKPLANECIFGGFKLFLATFIRNLMLLSLKALKHGVWVYPTFKKQ